MNTKRFMETSFLIRFLATLGLVDLTLSFFFPKLLLINYLFLWALFLIDKSIYKRKVFKLAQKYYQQEKYYQEFISFWEIINYWNRKIISYSLMGFGLYVIVAAQFAPIKLPVGILTLFATFLFIFGQRIGSLDGRRLLKSIKHKKPILYLRSFLVDKQDENQKSFWFGKQIIRHKEEHVLANMFEAIGPFIAIGNPKEWLPNIGAARLYVDHDQWQEEVINLMKESSFVLLRIGNTPGFQWEIRQALLHVKLENILIYFSQYMDENSLHESYERVREIIRNEIGLELPKTIQNERILYFDKTDTPLLTGGLNEYKKHMTTGCLIIFFSRYFEISAHKKRLGNAMKPYFEQRGIKIFNRALFGDLEIFLGFFVNPIVGGIMLFRNLMVNQKYLFGSIFLVLCIIFYISVDLLLTPLEESQTFLESLTSPQFRSGISFLSAIIFYILWKKFSSKKIRLHLAFGGKRVPWWITVLIMFMVVVIIKIGQCILNPDCLNSLIE